MNNIQYICDHANKCNIKETLFFKTCNGLYPRFLNELSPLNKFNNNKLSFECKVVCEKVKLIKYKGDEKMNKELYKKFQIDDPSKPKFEPFSVKIEIQTEEEAKEWALRFKLSIQDLNKIYGCSKKLTLDLQSKNSFTYISGIGRLIDKMTRTLRKRNIQLFDL